MMECYFKEFLPHHNDAVVLLGMKDGCEVYLCEECGLVFSPKLSKEEYLKIYSTPGAYFKRSVGKGYETFEDRFIHDYKVMEPRIRNILERLKTPAKVLDVGCGNCAMLKRLTEAGFFAMGIDLDGFSISRGHSFAGPFVTANADFLDFDFKDSFDAVLFTDSFEHLLYSHSYVTKAVSLLRDSPAGLIVVETPDTDSDGWIMQRLDWIHCKPVEHPFLYARRHIEAIFLTVGYVIESVVYTIPGRAIYYLRSVGTDHGRCAVEHSGR